MVLYRDMLTFDKSLRSMQHANDNILLGSIHGSTLTQRTELQLSDNKPVASIWF